MTIRDLKFAMCPYVCEWVNFQFIELLTQLKSEQVLKLHLLNILTLISMGRGNHHLLENRNLSSPIHSIEFEFSPSHKIINKAKLNSKAKKWFCPFINNVIFICMKVQIIIVSSTCTCHAHIIIGIECKNIIAGISTRTKLLPACYCGWLLLTQHSWSV